MLLPLLGNSIKSHEEVLSLQPMFAPKRFDTPPPHDWVDAINTVTRFRWVQIFLSIVDEGLGLGRK